MRAAWPVLVALLVAGCAGAPPPDETFDPTPTSTPAPTPTPSPTTTPTPTPTPSPTPEPPRPVGTQPVVGFFTHDFYEGPVRYTLRVPQNAAPLSIDLWFSPQTRTMPPSCDSENLGIRVIDPAGKVVAETPRLARACPDTTRVNETYPAAGTWTIEFDGRGDAQGYARMGTRNNDPPREAPPPSSFHVNVSHDHWDGPITKTFTVPEEAGKLRVRIHWTAGAAGCTPGLRVVLKAPDGTVWKEGESITAVDPPVTGGGDCGGPGEDGARELPAGTWKVEFSGQGHGTGWLRIRP